jgi:hypothetical protein
LIGLVDVVFSSRDPFDVRSADERESRGQFDPPNTALVEQSEHGRPTYAKVLTRRGHAHHQGCRWTNGRLWHSALQDAVCQIPLVVVGQ